MTSLIVFSVKICLANAAFIIVKLSKEIDCFTISVLLYSPFNTRFSSLVWIASTSFQPKCALLNFKFLDPLCLLRNRLFLTAFNECVPHDHTYIRLDSSNG